jgi:ribosomal protein S18 acetylase RimI-like enzyme
MKLYDNFPDAGGINDIRHKCEMLNGIWYRASLGEDVVGEVGIVPFTCIWGKIGRLQDVDILPEYQGRGLGRQLLIEACRLAKLQGLNALCLMAKENDWPKDWYLRYGFIKVGEIATLKL